MMEVLRAFRADIRHEELDLALYMISNAAFSITHRGVIARPPQYSDAVIQEHLTDLLLSYLTHSPLERGRSAAYSGPTTP